MVILKRVQKVFMCFSELYLVELFVVDGLAKVSDVYALISVEFNILLS